MIQIVSQGYGFRRWSLKSVPLLVLAGVLGILGLRYLTEGSLSLWPGGKAGSKI